MNTHRPRLITFVLLLTLTAVVLAQPIGGQKATVSEIVAASQRTIDELRNATAKKFSLDVGAITPETDLVADMGLDRTDLHYWLLELFKTWKIPPAPRELTRVRDIAHYVDNAQALESSSTKGVGAPGGGQEEEPKSYVQQVFFATNRNAMAHSEPEQAFGGDRAAEGKVTYGIASVNIPITHKKGQIETPFMNIRMLRDPGNHIYILGPLKNLSDMEFFSVLATTQDDLLVYIHGFNVTFEDAIKRAAQIAFDFSFSGPPITYTWPSDGGDLKNMLHYNSDAEDALWSVKYIEGFLSTLHERFPKRKIHIIAHSMGTRVLLNAMRLMAYRNPNPPKFGTVLLCAPDFDAGLFAEQIAREIRDLANHWVVYSSNKDIALVASEKLNIAPRLGNTLTLAEGYQIIDASDLEVTPWSVPETHSYYAIKQRVIDDMIGAIRGLSPKERSLEAQTLAAGTLWLLR